MSNSELDTLCVNTIRCLAPDVVQKAKSGHPGMPMGMSAIAHVLFSRFMNFSSKNPKFANRDRFLLSNGHGCVLQYIMLHLCGYDLTMDDLKKFRQLHSKTPGHPENHVTPGIEVTTGPLGQGLSNAVGLAIAREHLKAEYNTPDFPLLDNYIYVFCGDGCLMEGITSEAASLAGHLGLGSLIVLYDDNKISIDGDTSITFTEDVLKRFESYGWHTQSVKDGDTDYKSINDAIEEARNITDRPSIIKIATTIGYGSVNQGLEKVHGAALGDEDIAQVKKRFGFDPTKTFYIPEQVYELYRKVSERGATLESKWNDMFAQYKSKFPEKAAEFERIMSGKVPQNWESTLPKYTPKDKPLATRQLSEICLNSFAKVIPELMGGSADLTGSNLTFIKASKDFQKGQYEGRYIRFGVREHAMAAICNGMAAYGGSIPYCATFLNFIGYAIGAVRLSALSEFGVIYIMTHDSIGLGEDGPTHQPVETLPMLRSTPNLYTFRPADGNETSGAYAIAVNSRHTPSVLCLTRQALPQLEGSSIESVAKGAYVLQSDNEPQIILAGTGSEVSICVEAAKLLQAHSIKTRVVSMPCWELFEKQTSEYRRSVFPAGIPVLSVEAASIFGWQKYSHAQVGMTTFGASGPFQSVYEYFGITSKNVCEKATKLVEHFKTRAVPDLLETSL